MGLYNNIIMYTFFGIYRNSRLRLYIYIFPLFPLDVKKKNSHTQIQLVMEFGLFPNTARATDFFHVFRIVTHQLMIFDFTRYCHYENSTANFVFIGFQIFSVGSYCILVIVLSLFKIVYTHTRARARKFCTTEREI